MSDWDLLPNGNLLPYWNLLPNGNLLSNGHLLSNWDLLSDWDLLSNWDLLPDWHLLPNGNLLPDGNLLPNWHLLPDGHCLSQAVVRRTLTVLQDCHLLRRHPRRHCRLLSTRIVTHTHMFTHAQHPTQQQTLPETVFRRNMRVHSLTKKKTQTTANKKEKRQK